MGIKRGQQVRYRAVLRQTVGMNKPNLIQRMCDAKGAVRTCGNQVFLQPR
jgi:hypothetical protein